MTLAARTDLDAINAALDGGESLAVLARRFDLNYETLKSHARRRRLEGTEAQVEIELDQETDGDIVQAVEAARAEAARVGGRVSRVTVEKRSGTWDAQTKTGLAELESKRRAVQVTVVLPEESAEGRAEIRQAAPIDVAFKASARLPKREETASKWAVIMPDAQRPFEDQAAVDVALQILVDVQAAHGVDRLIHLGDDLDLPDLSRHRSAPAALGMIQEAINRQYRILATERAICPDAAISWIAGNHDSRLINWLVDFAPHLVGISRAGEAGVPVLSIEYLCRLAELGVEYVGPFPEGEVYLNSHLRACHGDIMKSQKGQTAASYLAQGQVSTIYGHIHRAELVYQTRHTSKGPRTYLAGSPGCLCRIDGAVPSAKSGITSTGVPGMRRTEDWQQGIWVVSYETAGRELYTVEPIHIWGGRASWRGNDYVARCDVDGNAA
jgi:hypothetical protein